jgi:hypothetical protein
MSRRLREFSKATHERASLPRASSPKRNSKYPRFKFVQLKIGLMMRAAIQSAGRLRSMI